MKMHLLAAGDMVNDSHSIFDGLQNNNLSLLDIFVRESLQNSLDAHLDDADTVNVNYVVNDFDNTQLAPFFPEINLTKKFKNNKQRFIAICDSNTKGLNGPTSYKERRVHGGNFNRLVYQIHKPQEQEGAGGSHGLGKTIYFRMGKIGLVIFYSRVKNEKGKYENRLAATFAEDYNSKDALLDYGKEPPTGIAWWGKETDDKHTEPLINDKEIEEILNVFGLELYTGDKTGTIIITPYIDEEFLCKLNHFDNSSDNGSKSFWWHDSVAEYLEVAVARWYNPRITYAQYPYGANLSVSINETEINVSNYMVFKVFQDLYNFATDAMVNNTYKTYEPGYEIPEPELITMRGVFEHPSSPAGAFAYTKVAKELFKSEPSPYAFINKPTLEDSESHKNIIAFVRSPGMIIDYITDHELFRNMIQCDKDHYILGLFVLNSDNNMKLKKSDLSLEEYIRKSELSDHCQWEDIPVEYNDKFGKPPIVERIMQNIYATLNKKFSEKVVTNDGNFCGAQASYYGPKLLAKLGYGRDPSKKLTEPKGIGSGGGNKAGFHIDGVQFENGNPVIISDLTLNENRKDFDFELAVKADNGAIKLSEWKDIYMLDCPFEFDSLEIKEKTASKYTTFANNQDVLDKGDFIINWKKIDNSLLIGAFIKLKANKKMIFDLKLHVKVLNKELQMEIKNSFEVEKHKDSEEVQA